MVKNLLANAGDGGSVFGSERPPREGIGNPAQYSCLGNSEEVKNRAQERHCDCH